MNRKKVLGFLIAATIAAVTVVLTVGGAEKERPEGVLNGADRLFEQKNYKEAADAYQKVLAEKPKHEKWVHAAQRVIVCKLRLRLYEEALTAAQQFIKLAEGTPYEARAERLKGNLYMLLPHWGTRAGGEFHRAQHKQGIRVRSYTYDKKHAIAHMERARVLYAKYDGDKQALAVLPEQEREGWHNERIECLFDFAAVCTRFGIYENSYQFWYSYWGERDEFRAETAGEEDFDEYHSYWQLRRKRPIGLRLGPDGKPIFPTTPQKYTGDLPDTRKILFLLDEIRKLDKTDELRHAGRSWYRQAMLARTRFGMDRMSTYANLYYSGRTRALKEELDEFKPWELDDDEAIVLAGGHYMKVKLPRQWDVLGLLKLVAGDYQRSGVADEAQYGRGLYYQSRQQYKDAIAEYEVMQQRFADSEWADDAQTQVSRIRQPQVKINSPGVQLPTQPAKLQISHRNTSKVWLVARRIDHIGFMRELRDQEIDKNRGWRNFWALRSWSQYFTYYRELQQIAVKHIGAEVARWVDEVKDDGTHRYAQATVQTPFEKRGAYLVYAYLKEPPRGHAELEGQKLLALGETRGVAVLTDLALVEKRARDGKLYFITDAATGKPVPEAQIDVLEVWNRYNRDKRKTEYFKARHTLSTDKNGIAVLPKAKSHNGQLHALVTADDQRVAWGGMTYWSHYHPSRMKQGMFAYCITDRPAYRPLQTVHFKVWVREMRDGILQNIPHRRMTVTIYDPRGNKVATQAKQTDQWGGFDGEVPLGEEPRLGVYRIYVHGRNYVGGQNFRVEEYKKPEFEVTVEPGSDLVKLGDKVSAVIKAKYYFGEPVKDGTVEYKVFREEYTHSYYFPGRWDWLYGAGYGWSWYSYDWYPWWGRVLRCWSPPGWWWGFYGHQPPNPVRELVNQGKAPIGEDGTLKVEIDTQPALKQHPDRNHRYIIKAEVRDPSRRVITGEGSVKVTSQSFYAFVQADQGYNRPGEEMVVRVRCLTPGNEPVQTEGTVTVSSVVFGGPDNEQIKEEVVKQWKASTDERGMLKFRLRYEKSGQLKIKFAAPDKWGGIVEGYGIVWVWGEDFDGKLYRFNNLELITDKRTYQPGETAHIMINTKHPNSYVLFSDDVDNNALLSWRVVNVPNKSIVIDVPISKNHKPNFFVEATTVADARVHQQAKRICVPPEQGVMDVSVSTDKAEYKPGETAELKLVAKTPEGKPAQAQFTISAFDKSVLYIQSQYTPAIAKFFHGNLRHHSVWMQTNLTDQFAVWGYMHRPFQQLHPTPPAWHGIWGPTISDWRVIGEEELQQLGGVAEKKAGFARRRGSGAAAPMEADKAEAAEPEAAPATAMADRQGAKRKASGRANGAAAGEAETQFAEAEVRQQFADTALWQTTLTTDADGVATTQFKMPENLTTWKINVWGMTKGTRVGESATSAVTTKNLLVRLQAPRFFMEYDEVVISANVHNYLTEAKTARVSLDIPKDLLKFIGEKKPTQDVEVPAGGQTRVDWRVKVLKEGTAKLTVKALTDEESDAMAMTFPVLVHGIMQHITRSGNVRPQDEQKTVQVELTVPEKLRPEATKLEVQFSPTLVGAMLDALPYCIYYPYGCTEQTMSRFLPCVLTLKTLQNMGITLEDVRRVRGRMEEIRRIEQGENIKIYHGYAAHPIFDQGALKDMIDKGLSRIQNMQHGDGGWGWWQGGSSSGYMTSYVLYSLATAQRADVQVEEQMIQRGMRFLKSWEEQEMRKQWWNVHAQHAYVAYVLSLRKMQAQYQPGKNDKRSGNLIDRLWTGRDKLGIYGKSLLALALAELGQRDRAETVLRNIMQYKQENEETQVAWFRTPQRGWWYWWNSDIEANATALRAIVRIDPRSDVAPKLVKWLLNNRRNGYYWRSTRDTTLCIAAMSEFAQATGETAPDYTLTLSLDGGKTTKQVKINRDTFLTYDNRFVVSGVAIEPGQHTLAIKKDGPGALYYSVYLSYFNKEEHIPAAGHHLKVARDYYKLEQIPYEVEVEGSEGQKLTEKRLRYKRVPVKNGDTLKSGDVIQVQLKVKSDNNYTYLCFEDMKPAGCEPVALRSGAERQEGFYSYMELRDEKVVFFVDSLQQGEHLLRYRLRAEIPGVFHALPTKLYGMYVPELNANSEEILIKIVD